MTDHPTRLRSRVPHSVSARLAARRVMRKLAALRNARRREVPDAQTAREREAVRQLIRDQMHRHAEPWAFERQSWIRRAMR